MRKPTADCIVLVVFVALPSFVSQSLADCPYTLMGSDGSVDTGASAPIARYRYARAVYLMTAEEVCGGPCPTWEFSGIGWTYDSAPSSAATAPLRVYLENTSDTTNLKSTTWTTALSGMTLVHDADTPLPGVGGPFDIAFSAGAFSYSGGNLYVAFDWGQYTGNLSSSGTISTSTLLSGGIKRASSNTAAPTAMVSSDYRPETHFSIPVPDTDVSVRYVVSMGAIPLGLVGAQEIRATVVQNGDLDLTDIPVTLDITGAETLTDDQTAPSLAGCGGFDSVTFAPFMPTLTGADILTASVPPNPIPSGWETLSTPMDVTLNRYSYAHAGVVGDWAVTLGMNGEVVAKFDITSATQVDAVTIDFHEEAAGSRYRIEIRGNDGTGKPGALLYLDAADRIVGNAGGTTIRLPSPIAVGAGSFFAGIRQTGSASAYLGFTYEYPGRSGAFYFTTGAGGWFDVMDSNVANTRLNFGVTLGNCLAPLTVDVTPGGTTNAACGSPIVFTATPTGTAPFTYQWTENGSDIPGATASSYTASHASGGFTYNCKVTDSGGCSNVQAVTASTGTWGPTATVSGGGSICAGGSSDIQAALAGTGPWNLTWSDGFAQNGVAASPATRTVNPAATTTYTVTAISDSSCTGTSGGSALVTVNPIPAEIASGSGSGNILEWSGTEVLVWPANPGASSYTLYRGQRADLPQLLGSAVDSCTRYQGAATSASGLGEVSPNGDFFFYLVTGMSAGGCEGVAGGGRVVNSAGPCP